jgi:hypothetical protein
MHLNVSGFFLRFVNSIATSFVWLTQVLSICTVALTLDPCSKKKEV